MVEDEEPKAKKPKVFSIEEFKQNLHSNYKISYLQHFLKLCQEKKHNYIQEYLETGGSCDEILSIAERDPDVPPILILEVIYFILLEILARHPKLHGAAHKSCSLLLNRHITMLNKMLSLSSQTSERKVVLKLLTMIVSLSASLAKDVLIHVNFNPDNLKILTKRKEAKSPVREAFVNFLCSFLIDGHHPTISAFLAKPNLLGSVVNGLIYDEAEIVCVFLTTVKQNVLESGFVNKTAKMKVFTTHVIRDLVNLYNWKGPKGVRTQKATLSTADQLQKSKVNECIHDFLLILCTTKHGVIFRDNHMGIGKPSQNKLMLTVLQGLERPWEHSYASHLVRKICETCPDTAKVVWSNVSEYVTPRETENWTKTVDFARDLIRALPPEKIRNCVGNLTAQQMALATETLIAPPAAMKGIKADGFENLKLTVKTKVFEFLGVMLKGFEGYLVEMKKWLDDRSYLSYKNSIRDYLNRNFPPVGDILSFEFETTDSKLIMNYLCSLIDLLNFYYDLSPELLDNLHDFDLKKSFDFLRNISTEDDEVIRNSYKIRVKIIELLLKNEPTSFYPNSELFSETLSILLKAYYILRDSETYKVINHFLLNSTIFENYEYEINVWINAIFNCKKCGSDLRDFIIKIMQLAFEKSGEYTSKMSEIQKDFNREIFDLKDFLENLSNEKYQQTVIKDNNLSQVIFALFDVLKDSDSGKSIKNYVSYLLINLFHQQSNPETLLKILKEKDFLSIPEKIKEYLLSSNGRILTKNKGVLINILSELSESFLDDEKEFDFEKNFETCDAKEVLKSDVFNLLVFIINNSTSENNLSSKYIKKFLSYLEYLDNDRKYIFLLLKNSNFLKQFSLLNSNRNLIMSLVVEVVKNQKDSDFDQFLRCYRTKIFNDLLKIIKKSKYKDLEYENVLDVIKTFGLSQDQCIEFLRKLVKEKVENFMSESGNLSIIYHLTSFVFNQLVLMNADYKDFETSILDSEVIDYFKLILIFLTSNSNQDISALITPFMDYLNLFPHLIKDFDELLLALLLKNEFSKEGTLFVCFLLERNPKLIEIVIENIEKINFTKGMYTSILNVCVKTKFDLNSIKKMYGKFEPILLKSLEKPQKAGVYFEQFYVSIGEVMKAFFGVEKCKSFVQKVNKFEISEPFVTYLLKTIYEISFGNEKPNDKLVNNSILTFTNLILNLFKKKQFEKLDSNIEIFINFLGILPKDVDYTTTTTNDNFKNLVKFLLKFGISGKSGLINLLKTTIKMFKFPSNDLQEIIEMLTSHSEFMDLILEENNETKTELVELMYEIFVQNEDLMDVSYVPLMLAAYGGTMIKSDRILLNVLRLLESKPQQTNFYDFKPFLWGKAAVNHYSVKSDIQKSLWREPRIGTILDLLEIETVLNTIKNFPLELPLNSKSTDFQQKTYDLSFLLPLFTSILSPENSVQTYRFTQSGALSLTIIGLSSKDKDLRAASAFVLSRFHSHVELRKSGKDNLLWIRFIEAICRGICNLNGFQINNFVSIFLSKMALILTNPTHIMYTQISQYLTAKSVLDFKQIPELFTLLFSPDLNYKEHRKFILEILIDGMRTENDFKIGLSSISFKLVMEFYNSCLCGNEEKRLILVLLEKTTKIGNACKLLCKNYGFLSWLSHIITDLLEEPEKSDFNLLNSTLDILLNIKDYSQLHRIINVLIDKINMFKQDFYVLKLLKLISFTFKIDEDMLRSIIRNLGNKECLYYLDYNQTFVNLETTEESVGYYLKDLTLRWIKTKKGL